MNLPVLKPHAPSCERNRDVILEVLTTHLADRRHVLEIGSGTGQHAIHFAAELPELRWQCSDRSEALEGIALWLHEAGLENLPPPIALDVTGTWPSEIYDCVFSSNTLHIMSWDEVEKFFAGLKTVLAEHACLVIYGPFNYGGQFTSESNAEFDQWLKARVPHQGIRDFEAVNALAKSCGLELIEDRAMPANNRCLVWCR